MVRLVRLIVPIACLLIIQGVYAIDIHFSASCGGESVGMTDSYDVDDSVGVSGTSSASFNGSVSMTDRQSLSGSGDADIKQVMYGSGGDADYVINYALETLGASKIEGTGSSALTPVAGSASRSVSTTGTSLMTSDLSGVQSGDFAGVESYVLLGDVSTTQKVATGESVTASQNMSAKGLNVAAYGGAIDAYGNWAETSIGVVIGRVVADQEVEAGNSAFASQTAELEGCAGWAWAWAEDEEGNEAWTESFVEYGRITTGQDAAADDGAFASQTTEVEGEDGWAESYAEDDERNTAATWAIIENGTLESDQMAWAVEDRGDNFEGVRAGQWTMITAENGSAMSRAEDTNGSYIKIGAAVENGSLETDQWVEAVNSARGYQNTGIVGDFALAFCEANNTDRGDFAYVANRIDGNASLEFEGNATVNASEAWANLSSHAEGDRIRGWATITVDTLSDNTTGSCDYYIRAYENGTRGYLGYARRTTI